MSLHKIAMLFIVLLMAGLAACSSNEHDHSADDLHAHDEYHRLTHWEGDLEVFARYELHDDSGSIEGELFISKGSQPAEDAAGSIRILENGTTAIEQELSSRQNGRFPFELEFRNSDTPVLNVQFRLNGEEFSIDLGTIDRHADHPEEPDVEDLAELDKPMQWRLAIESGFADYSDIPKVVSGFGTVLYNPNYYREITSPVDGQINSENFSVVPASGTRVQSGDRLVSISPSLTAQNSWIEARLAFQQAKEAYERAQRLIENDAISLREYQEREREFEVRRAGYEHFTGGGNGVQVEDGGANLNLISTRSGVIAESHILSGRPIRQGDPLFTLFDPARLWLEVSAYRDELIGMPEITGAEIRTGRDESITLNSSQVQLVSRDLRSDASGARAKIILDIHNADETLSLNQPVRVRLKGDESRSVLAVPTRAIFDNEAYKVVFVMHSGDQFERRTVQTGTSYGGYTEITSGLETGERIVTRGIYPLHLMTGNVQIDDDHDH
jgi:membrane fusion protein, heavy metal efflux system